LLVNPERNIKGGLLRFSQLPGHNEQLHPLVIRKVRPVVKLDGLTRDAPIEFGDRV